jgi:hypothetical protein
VPFGVDGLLLMAAAILIAAGLVIGDDADPNGPATAAVLVLIAADIFVIGTTVGVWFAAGYARWRLAKSPWRSCACRFVVVPSLHGSGEPTLVLDDGGQHHVLCRPTVKRRWRALDARDGKRIWFAGDPESGGVVAPPGGAPLLWAYRPRSKRRRARPLRRATKHEVRSSSVTADDPERAQATDLAIGSLRLGALTQTALVGGVATTAASFSSPVNADASTHDGKPCAHCCSSRHSPWLTCTLGQTPRAAEPA